MKGQTWEGQTKHRREVNHMSKVKLYSNFVRVENATILDADNQQDEILDIVKQALKHGAKEIYFCYKEEGPECEASPVNTVETL
jgi:hypothetical protein